MMSVTLVTKDVQKHSVLVLNNQIASALSDPIRVQILSILSHKSMNADEISDAIKQVGDGRATSTIRHHLGVLKKAGLIDICRMEEVKGAITKYYDSRVLMLEPTPIPKSSSDTKLLDDLTKKLGKTIIPIARNEKLYSQANTKPVCSLCGLDHFRESTVIELLNLAIARVVGSEEFKKAILRTDPLPKTARGTKTKLSSGA